MTLFLPALDLRRTSRTTLVGLVHEANTDTKLLDQIARIYFKDLMLMADLIRHPVIGQETLVFLLDAGPSEIQMELKARLECLPALREAKIRPAVKKEAEDEASVYQMVQQMSIAEKVRFALKADKTARSLLIKDPNKQVALAVVESPKITEQEVEGIARSRNVSEDVLRAIAKKREWLKNYAIVHALVGNPKTPAGIAVSLLPTLKAKDLALLLKGRGVSEAVRIQASKLLKTKAST